MLELEFHVFKDQVTLEGKLAKKKKSASNMAGIEGMVLECIT